MPVGGVSTGDYAEPKPVVLPALLYAGWRNVGPGGATGVRARLSDNSWVDRNPYVSTGWWCRSVAASQSYPGTVWILTSDENADDLIRLYRSNDYGVTWTLVDYTTIDVNIESFDLRVLSSRGTDIYLGVHIAASATGVWKADAFNPTSWTHVGTLYPTGSGDQGFSSIWPASDRIWFENQALISSVNRHFFYTLSGTTSVVIDSDTTSSVGYIIGTPGLASRAWGIIGSVSAGDKKVFRIDGTVATDITPFANGSGSTFEWVFAIDSNTVFVSYFDDSLNQSSLYRSVNAGSSWTLISGISGHANFRHGGVMSADQDNPNRLYAGGSSGNIWISTDAGLTWAGEYTGAHTFVDAPLSMSAGYPLR